MKGKQHSPPQFSSHSNWIFLPCSFHWNPIHSLFYTHTPLLLLFLLFLFSAFSPYSLAQLLSCPCCHPSFLFFLCVCLCVHLSLLLSTNYNLYNNLIFSLQSKYILLFSTNQELLKKASLVPASLFSLSFVLDSFASRNQTIKFKHTKRRPLSTAA